MLLAWKDHGIITLAGYILGFPADTPESIRADIDIIKRELPIDIMEFFCLTPLPGSEDHQTLWRAGVAMDPDLNNYDIEHVCNAHPLMSPLEWQAIYREAWSRYYTDDHIETLLRRAAATGVKISSLVKLLAIFSTAVRVEDVHPLQCGLFRQRHPSERRPGLAAPSALLFWPRFALDSVRKTGAILAAFAKVAAIGIRVARDPQRLAYTDQALTPVSDDDADSLDLFTQSASAKQAVAHQKKVFDLTHGTP